MLFGSVKLAKNNDIDKYKYSGYGIGFDSGGTFSFPNGSFGENVIIFGVDMSSSVHANNKINNILFLGKGFVQGINGTAICAGKTYSINFTKTKIKFCLKFCIIMVIIVIYLSVVQRFVNLKQKILKLYLIHYV